MFPFDSPVLLWSGYAWRLVYDPISCEIFRQTHKLSAIVTSYLLHWTTELFLNQRTEIRQDRFDFCFLEKQVYPDRSRVVIYDGEEVDGSTRGLFTIGTPQVGVY